MKSLLLICISCLLVMSCNRAVPSKYLHKGLSEKETILKNHIKSISVYLIYLPDSIKRNQYFSYDKNGNTTEAIYSTFNDKYLFFYDANGRSMSQVSFHGDKTPDTSVFIYDKNGAYILKTWHYIEKFDSAGRELESKDDFMKTTFIYDKRGDLLKESSIPIDKKGFGGSDETFKYDSLGNLIEEIDAIGGIDLSEDKSVYKYDSIGNEIEYGLYGHVEDYNNPWQLDYVSHRVYNSLGQRIRIKNIDASGKLKTMTTCFYNSDGTDDITFYYDNKGTIKSEKVYVYEYYR